MAPAASTSASRFRPIDSRSSSALGYATATSFKDAIHSTPQLENTALQRELSHDHVSDLARSENGSAGSTDMSIEMGRGVLRGARNRPDDLSSSAVFGFGVDNIQYELTGTPPIHGLVGSTKKNNATSRRDSSIRYPYQLGRNTDGLKRTVSANAAPSFPTRFTAERDLHANPHPTGFANTTIQSTTYTANHSFMLPDLPDITELVSGGRRDGTPVIKRGNMSRSRFTSASYKPQTQSYRSVSGVAIPEDEKAIFASLQSMKDKISQLEMEKSEPQIQAKEKWQDKTTATHGHVRKDADSIRVSHEDLSGHARLKSLSSVTGLQERLIRGDHELNTLRTTLELVTKERDALVGQISTAYITNEHLIEENEVLHQSHERLQAENDELRSDNERLSIELRLAQRHTPRGEDVTVAPGGDPQKRHRVNETVRSQKESKTVGIDAHNVRRTHNEATEPNVVSDVAARIEAEIKRLREEATTSKAPPKQRDQAALHQTHSLQSRSELRTGRIHPAPARSGPSRMRNVSAPAELVVSDAESTTDLDLSKGCERRGQQVPLDEDKDLTRLSDVDVEELARLRWKLEDELRAKRLVGNVPQSRRDETTRDRRSSSKDATRTIDLSPGLNGTTAFQGDDGVKVSKTVRVQSPHSSDEASQTGRAVTGTTHMPAFSNISRRRRRSANIEGETSAFIIPDLTVHRTQSVPTQLRFSSTEHIAAECTVCAPADQDVRVPMPVPVSERESVGDHTDATIRPSQAPITALASVIKNLKDEQEHLRIQREKYNRMYNQHDPALRRRKRLQVKAAIDRLTTELERRNDQIYALYDVLEGHKAHANDLEESRIEDTLTSMGIDPIELSGRVGRSAPSTGLDGLDEMSDEPPWEGLSDLEGEDELSVPDERRGAAV